MLVFSVSQECFAKGGQVQFVDFNLYPGVPRYLKDTEVVAPGGIKDGTTYKEYETEAQLFFMKYLDVVEEGDLNGNPFIFPKPQCHVTPECYEDETQRKILDRVCEVSSKNGSPYFLFDRDKDTRVSMCCRLVVDLDDALAHGVGDKIEKIEDLRFASPGNVTINLPRICFESKGNKDKFFANIERVMNTAALAHRQKKKFLDKIFAQPNGGMLSMLAHSEDEDGKSYVDTSKNPYLIGIIGVDDCVKYMMGKRMHESSEATMLGIAIVNRIKKHCKTLTKENGFPILPVQTPAESAGNRMARMDMEEFAEECKMVVQGDLEDSTTVYYTNSTQISLTDPTITPDQRVKIEGKFHRGLSGCITHIYGDSQNIPPENISKFVDWIYHNTKNEQVVFSPIFTMCNSCDHMGRGLVDKCEKCGSEDLDAMTRIVGYYSKISRWNKSKKWELEHRSFANAIDEDFLAENE